MGALSTSSDECLAEEIPDSFADLLLSARLLPFRKKDDGVRPFAVGEVQRCKGRPQASAAQSSKAPFGMFPTRSTASAERRRSSVLKISISGPEFSN